VSVKLSERKIEEVVAVVNEKGLSSAADILGTSKATLCRLLRTSGYTIHRVYKLSEEYKASKREATPA